MKKIILVLGLLLSGCMAPLDSNDLYLASQQCGGYERIHKVDGIGARYKYICKLGE